VPPRRAERKGRRTDVSVQPGDVQGAHSDGRTTQRRAGHYIEQDQLYVLHACEGAVRRLADRPPLFRAHRRGRYFADVRCYFPVARQQQVYSIIERYIAFADEFLAFAATGRAAMRRGTRCSVAR